VLRAVSAGTDRVQIHFLATIWRRPIQAGVVKPPRVQRTTMSRGSARSTVRAEAGASGRIADKRPWTAAQIYALPEQDMIIKHICVEGWDYIGQWSGVNLRQFLERVGADLTAKYVAFRCADDYTESVDMPTALHPQTMLATKYAREPITDPFGFPLRLRTATKLGFKNAKWVTAIEVTNDFQETFWSKQGFNWFAGI
jgi:DMSO/TMAO reductase YedYZ molybdopterin-dependent catalytic subunit